MGKEWVIDGFFFQSEEEAKAANKELEGIHYIQERLNMNRPEAVLQVYLKLIQDDMFHTPVGLCYLKELQTLLLESTVIMDDEIVPIDVIARSKPADKAASEKINNEAIIEKSQREKEDKKEQKKRNRPLLIMNGFLILTIIAMFALSATSNVPTILNYENKIIDKYEQWEKELQQREDSVLKREQQLDAQEKNGDN